MLGTPRPSPRSPRTFHHPWFRISETRPETTTPVTSRTHDKRTPTCGYQSGETEPSVLGIFRLAPLVQRAGLNPTRGVSDDAPHLSHNAKGLSHNAKGLSHNAKRLSHNAKRLSHNDEGPVPSTSPSITQGPRPVRVVLSQRRRAASHGPWPWPCRPPRP